MVEIQIRAGRSAHEESYRAAILDVGRCVVVAEAATDAVLPAVIGWGQTYHHTKVVDRAPVGHYLGGVTVDPAWRRQGVAIAPTDARMRWIGQRAIEAFYVVNPRNLASIDLHRRWRFEEVARSHRLTGVEFSGGVGILLRATVRTRIT